MKILVINCGSSSLKYQLLNMEQEMVLAKGLVERIALEGSVLTHYSAVKDQAVINTDIPDHSAGIKLVLDALTDAAHGVISGLSEITAVGHRVVHGGEKFSRSVLITAVVKEGILACYDLAPLHNPANMLGINACEKFIPGAPQVAVFDSAFHQTMPKHAYLYGLPYEVYEKYGVRKYGFHGASHRYVAERAACLLARPLDKLKLITCHLGNGASVTAVQYGKSVDTSMGFTPLEGLVMGTRCGNIDPAVVPYLMKKEGFTPARMDDYLNKESGVLGISGLSSDFRDLEDTARKGHEHARLALEIFAYRVRCFIGAYVAVMNGVHAIVFTGGLGENSSIMRERICHDLDFLGIDIDHARNNVEDIEAEISRRDGKVKIFLVPTNEELVIARDTKEICQSLVKTGIKSR